MQRTMVGYAVTAILILGLGVPTSPGATTLAYQSRHASHANHVTACGVERWSIKTGLDADARLVNQKVAVPTNIIRLRSLPAPTYLPAHSPQSGFSPSSGGIG